MLHLRFLRRMMASCALDAAGHGLAYPGEGLMAVEAAQLDDGSVEREALGGEAGFAEADAARVVVEHLGAAQQAHLNAIELGRAKIPELDSAKIVEMQGPGHVSLVLARRQHLRGLGQLTISVVERGFQAHPAFHVLIGAP